MIGIPHDGKPVVFEWGFTLAQLHPPMNFDTRMTVVQGKPVAEAREQIAEEAVKVGAKYLFFFGTDVTFPPFTLRQLIWHLDHYPKYAVAGGIYCHKSPPQSPMVFRGNGLGPYMDWKVGEVFDVSGMGMDCTLIRTDIFKYLEKPWFKTVDDASQFLEGINNYSMWTEDLWFCYKVKNTCLKCKKHSKFHRTLDDGKEQNMAADVSASDWIADHKFEPYGVMADGGILADHWDTQSHTKYSLPIGSKPFQRYPMGKKKVADFGCGMEPDSYHTNEGPVMRVDIREDVKPDFRCDLRKTPFATGEFDVIYSGHTLEHFSRNEVFEVVEEIARVLKPDGELRLTLPNLEWAAQHIMNGEVDSMVMDVLYGAQTYEENYHKTGFTPAMVEQMLKQKGFKHFIWDKQLYHMMVRAWKIENPEVDVINPVFSLKQIEVARMVEEQQKNPNPNVDIADRTIVIHPPEEQFEQKEVQEV